MLIILCVSFFLSSISRVPRDSFFYIIMLSFFIPRQKSSLLKYKLGRSASFLVVGVHS
jgi:hypothetical protein